MPEAFAFSLRDRGTSVSLQAAYVDAATIPFIGRPLTKPLLRARLYIRAARSVTTSGRFRRPDSPLSWLIARDRFLAIDDPSEAPELEPFVSVKVPVRGLGSRDYCG